VPHLDTSTVKNIVQLGTTVPDVWVVRHDALPFTVNETRNWHYMKLAKNVKDWREAGCWLSREAKVPKMNSADIHCITHLKRKNRDIGAEMLALKAFLDGAITDAGVMPDDRPPYVRSITFHEPVKDSTNGMTLLIARHA
jgi:hypothetical protein